MSKKISSPILLLLFKVREMRNAEMDFMLGKVLTIIDSLIVNDRQNKATKDVIRTSFYEKNYHWSELEEILRQFKDKFCPKIEEDYEYKLETEERSKNCNYFPEE